MSEAAAPPGLDRKIGLIAASLSGIGIVLGAGIYVLVGEAAGLAGNGLWAAFALGAVLASATGLSYAELTSLFPEAGAAAAYAEEAFGARTGFLAGWMDICVNFIAAPAVALGFGNYFASLTGLHSQVGAIAAILICAGIVLAGVTQTMGLASVFAVIEAAGLALVIAIGLPYLGDVPLVEMHNGWSGMLGAAALVFFAYEGFEEIATLSEEVIDPTRNIPRAFLIAIGATSALYVLVAAVAVSVVPWETLADSGAPLALVAEVAANDRVADGLSVLALFATFNTVLLVLATGARAMYGMAQRNLLPRVVGRISRTRRIPWVALTIATSVSLAFAATGDIGYIAQVTNFAVFALFISVNGSLIRLRFTRPDLERPFRTPGSLMNVPLIPVVGLLGAVVLSFSMSREAFLTGVIALAFGVGLSFVMLRPRAAR
ncbi:MAG: APC family permease [Chloroflexi bacterium]|nr:APC family permease [Chloroflexota bacterium]